MGDGHQDGTSEQFNSLTHRDENFGMVQRNDKNFKYSINCVLVLRTSSLESTPMYTNGSEFLL